MTVINSTIYEFLYDNKGGLFYYTSTSQTPTSSSISPLNVWSTGYSYIAASENCQS